MSRAERLLSLLENLRSRRFAVSGQVLAGELGVSLRTLYRDIEALQAQGAAIEGEAGVGYVLKPGFTLPPLMFGVEELEALVLGIRWVHERGDEALAASAESALAKIESVLPPALRPLVESDTLLVPSQERPEVDGRFVAAARKSMREERMMRISYRAAEAKPTERRIWPFAMGFFDQVLMVVAWCELRRDFRHFRADRVSDWTALEERYPRRRLELFGEWRSTRGRVPTGSGSYPPPRDADKN